MGIFDRIFGTQPKGSSGEYFKTLTAYQPTFTTWGGQMYEMELVRSSIHAKAKHASKLKVEVVGSALPKLQRKLKKNPNDWQTWGQFMYRLSTILDMQNTAFIAPVENDFGDVSGVFPLLPSRCDVLDYEGVAWLRYRFDSGKVGLIELERVGIMTKFQYKSDLFGETNRALNDTLELMDIQSQGIKEAVKSSATFRFMAKMNNFAKPEDIAKEQERFTKNNLKNEAGGVLLFPNTYSDIQQIKSTPYVVDEAQMNLIRTNVFEYFGVNEDVLQNKTYGDSWSAFYEGEVEPFAIQFSEVMTKMLFTDIEQSNGAEVMATANRLQYMSNADKLAVSSQMADRGIMNRDEIREIWNLPPLPNGEGQKYIIRGEYYFTDQKEGDSND